MNSKWFFFYRLMACIACLLSLVACRSDQILQAAPNKTISKTKVDEAELKRALNASLDDKKFTPLWFKPLEVPDRFQDKELLYQKGISKRRSDGAVLIIEVWIAASPDKADRFVERSVGMRSLFPRKNAPGQPLIGEEVWRSAGVSGPSLSWYVLSRQGRAVVQVMLLAKDRKDKTGKLVTKPLSATDFKFVDTQAIATLRQLKEAGFVK